MNRKPSATERRLKQEGRELAAFYGIHALPEICGYCGRDVDLHMDTKTTRVGMPLCPDGSGRTYVECGELKRELAKKGKVA